MYIEQGYGRRAQLQLGHRAQVVWGRPLDICPCRGPDAVPDLRGSRGCRAPAASSLSAPPGRQQGDPGRSGRPINAEGGRCVPPAGTQVQLLPKPRNRCAVERSHRFDPPTPHEPHSLHPCAGCRSDGPGGGCRGARLQAQRYDVVGFEWIIRSGWFTARVAHGVGVRMRSRSFRSLRVYGLGPCWFGWPPCLRQREPPSTARLEHQSATIASISPPTGVDRTLVPFASCLVLCSTALERHAASRAGRFASSVSAAAFRTARRWPSSLSRAGRGVMRTT